MRCRGWLCVGLLCVMARLWEGCAEGDGEGVVQERAVASAPTRGCPPRQLRDIGGECRTVFEETDVEVVTGRTGLG
jgi:hypothetical protein